MESLEVWCPSDCTIRRMEEFFGCYNGVRIRSAVPYYDAEVKDGGYAYMALREIPDRNLGWFEQACEELKIPYKVSGQQLEYEDYKEVMANCRLLVVPYYELSTGGLSMMEAHYLGKPILTSDSPYNGGRDYIEDRAIYFRHHIFSDLKRRLNIMFNNPPKPRKDHKEYVIKNFSEKVMGRQMMERLIQLSRR